MKKLSKKQLKKVVAGGGAKFKAGSELADAVQ